MRKLILDTDIGDDIDDALALALIMCSPDLQLLGVTTVFLNAERRAKLARRILRAYGRDDVPVHAGLDLPVLHQDESLIKEISGRSTRSHDEHGAYIPCQFLDDMEHESAFNRDAVRFIIDTAHALPGQVELVCIGAMTNAAMAIRVDPALPRLLSGITVMGGMFSEQLPEWNIRCDPEAAAIVLSSGADIHCVGLDVTLRCRLEIKDVERIKKIGSSATSLIGELVDRWLATYQAECPLLHDPLAVSTLIDPSIVTFESRHVAVGLEGPARSVTLARRSPPRESANAWGAAHIAVDLRRDFFMKLFLDRVTGQP
jgi:purine nucleosidase/pyrimidine-specific ribonucleoside hydrolase